MHYRWDYDEQLNFIKNDFTSGMTPPETDQASKDTLFEFASARMRKAKQFFGVTEHSIELVQQSYKEFLALFTAHLKHYPYLLGGRPTYGDYGLIAALYAHLGRDPVPAMQMRIAAPEVARWVERMNAPEKIVIEYADLSDELFSADNIPQTLIDLMKYVAVEYLPELIAHVDYTNNWLAQQKDLLAGTNGLEKPHTRDIGMATFEWRGINLTTAVMPYRFYLLQRIQQAFAQTNKDEQQKITDLFSITNMSDLLTIRTSRAVQRVNHLEVWGK
jgi:hypothetical protein